MLEEYTIQELNRIFEEGKRCGSGSLKEIALEMHNRCVEESETISMRDLTTTFHCCEFIQDIEQSTQEVKEILKRRYFEIPEDSRRYCLGDQDSKDFEIQFILGLHGDNSNNKNFVR